LQYHDVQQNNSGLGPSATSRLVRANSAFIQPAVFDTREFFAAKMVTRDCHAGHAV
jgi:hypothetical protein